MIKMTCISADSHVIEPGDLWLNYISDDYKERAPRVVDHGDHEIYECDGNELLPIGSVAAAGVPADQVRRHGRYETNVPRGGWDPKARIAEMDQDGVQAEVLYPTMAMRLYSLDDLQFQQACFQAYNNWVKDYCSTQPQRLKAVGLIPLGNVEAGITELKRCRKLGLGGASIAVYQDSERHYGDPVFDPFWAAAEEMDIPISLHILTEKNPKKKRDVSDGIVESQWIQRSLAHIVFNGVLERFPKIKLVSAENDVGWVPYFLERLDYAFDRRRNIYQMNISRKTPPSEMIRRNVYLTFMRDKAGVQMRHHIGLDRLMWSSDYPHNDSTWPESQSMIDYLMEDVPSNERHTITAGNAAQLYGFN